MFFFFCFKTLEYCTITLACHVYWELSASCLFLSRATQGDLLCARWRMGHGCRQAWWVLDLVVLIQTGQVCMPDWPATQASSAAQYRTYHCMVELITTGVEALWSCLAAWPPYWPCFTDETIWTMDFLEVVRLMKEKVHMYANLHMKP